MVVSLRSLPRYKHTAAHVVTAAEAVFLERERFLGGEGLDEDFVADDFALLDAQRAALAERE